MSGFIVGLFLAILFKNYRFIKEIYDWERKDYDEKNDPFLQHFDIDGNFIEVPFNEENTTENLNNIKVKYFFVENKKTKKKK